jgi:hypothetical protein
MVRLCTFKRVVCVTYNTPKRYCPSWVVKCDIMLGIPIPTPLHAMRDRVVARENARNGIGNLPSLLLHTSSSTITAVGHQKYIARSPHRTCYSTYKALLATVWEALCCICLELYCHLRAGCRNPKSQRIGLHSSGGMLGYGRPSVPHQTSLLVGPLAVHAT